MGKWLPLPDDPKPTDECLNPLEGRFQTSSLQASVRDSSKKNIS